MKLRVKTLLTLGTIMAAMMMVTVILSSQLVMENALAHERKDVQLDLDRISASIETIESNMANTAVDWAAWDDTYAFIENRNSQYIDSNLGNETCISLKMDYLILFDRSEEVAYGLGYDYQSKAALNISDGLLATILANVERMDIDEPRDSGHGLVLTECGVLMVAVHPITDSSLSAPVNGFLVMARYIGAEEVQGISETVKAKAMVLPVNDSSEFRLDAVARNDVLNNRSSMVVPDNESVVSGYQAMAGVNGTAVALLVVQTDRDGVAQATNYMYLITSGVIMVSLVFCVFILVVTDRFTTRRVERLSRQIGEIGRKGGSAGHVQMDGSDELFQLAGEMNRTMDSLLSAERALHESERRYRAIVNDQTEMIVRINEDGTITFANEALLKELHMDEGSIIGLRVNDLMTPDQCAQFMEHCREAAVSERPVIVDHHYRSPFDKSDRWLSWSLRSIPVEGNVREVQGVGRDLTEKKMAETALAMANKKLNLLASVTRHDVMNKLTVAHGYVTIARSQAADLRTASHLAKAEAALQSIEGYLEFTRDYQRMGLAVPVWINLGQAIDKAAASVRSDGINVSVDVGDLEMLADPLVEKVFYNLLDNSERHGGRVTRIDITAFVDEKGMLLIFEDNGQGVPAYEKELIFNAGYGTNTGYGLFLAREILGASGMTIVETGESGEGARFEIEVPPGRFRNSKHLT